MIFIEVFDEVAVELKGAKCAIKEGKVDLFAVSSGLSIVKHNIWAFFQVKDALFAQAHFYAFCLLYCKNSQIMKFVRNLRENSLENILKKLPFFP